MQLIDDVAGIFLRIGALGNLVGGYNVHWQLFEAPAKHESAIAMSPHVRINA